MADNKSSSNKKNNTSEKPSNTNKKSSSASSQNTKTSSAKGKSGGSSAKSNQQHSTKKTAQSKNTGSSTAKKTLSSQKGSSQKGSSQKSSQKKGASEHAKKTSHPSHEKTSTSKGSDDKKSNKGMWIAIGVAAVVLVIAIIAAFMLMGGNSGEETQTNTSKTTSSTTSTSQNLMVVEDTDCKVCNTEAFIQNLENNLMPNLNVETISSDSEKGQEIINAMGAKKLPIYLFGSEVAERDDWSQISRVFRETSVNGESYYTLTRVPGNKVVLEAPEILNNTVVMGEEDAPVTIYEFTDFECPYCAIAEGNEKMVSQFAQKQGGDYQAPMPKIHEEYVETGKVKVVFYNYPVAQLHPDARGAHMAALCAKDQGEWYPYYRKLFESRTEWSEASDRTSVYKQFASDLGLDTEKFNQCLDSEKFDSQISKEQQIGQKMGVSGTPGFIIDDVFLSGAQSFSTFEDIIEAKLASE